MIVFDLDFFKKKYNYSKYEYYTLQSTYWFSYMQSHNKALPIIPKNPIIPQIVNLSLKKKTITSLEFKYIWGWRRSKQIYLFKSQGLSC